jgi:hypothetical protein
LITRTVASPTGTSADRAAATASLYWRMSSNSQYTVAGERPAATPPQPSAACNWSIDRMST